LKCIRKDPIRLLAFLAILKRNCRFALSLGWLVEPLCLINLNFLTILSVKLEIGRRESLDMALCVVSSSKALGVRLSFLEVTNSILFSTDHDVIRARPYRDMNALAFVALAFELGSSGFY